MQSSTHFQQILYSGLGSAKMVSQMTAYRGVTELTFCNENLLLVLGTMRSVNA